MNAHRVNQQGGAGCRGRGQQRGELRTGSQPKESESESCEDRESRGLGSFPIENERNQVATYQHGEWIHSYVLVLVLVYMDMDMNE